MAITCPKLDKDLGVYREKIKMLIDEAGAKSLTVMTMEVPCCTGLLNLCKEALLSAKRKVPVRHIIVSVRGKTIKDEEL